MIRSTIIDDEAFTRIEANAEAAWLNGKSQIRTDDREKYGMTDQLVGQMGEYALAKFLGDTDGYFARRDLINKTPWKGDGGSDITGHAVDVKTSLMRRQQDPTRYNLLVRPKERHKDNIYVLALVPSLEARKVLLVGWLPDYRLNVKLRTEGVLKGTYALNATCLNDMDKLRLKLS